MFGEPEFELPQSAISRSQYFCKMAGSTSARNCPKCGAVMAPAGSFPQLGGLPEPWAFKCLGCGRVATEAVPVPGQVAPTRTKDR